jgi:3-methyladenine DNA glycosylase AlkC
LANQIANNYETFNIKLFIEHVFDTHWEQKELKQRMRHITICLHQALPIKFKNQVEILKQTAPHFGGFTAMFFPDFIEVYGLNNLKISINALAHFTQFSSSEFAVRPFIIKYPNAMLKQHLAWSKHINEHVRRLASEGIRPRLPWAMALPIFKLNPQPIISILNNLMNDESEYVRRSVANCINDISKDNPETVIKIINKWKNHSINSDKLLKHASRGLLKKGNITVLNAFGLNNEHKIRLIYLKTNKLQIAIGENINFNFSIQLLEKNEAQTRLEYRIYYTKANGKQLPKIFQIGTYQLTPNQPFIINKKHSFVNLSTRKHYVGKHKITIIANGNEIGFLDFYLI